MCLPEGMRESGGGGTLPASLVQPRAGSENLPSKSHARPLKLSQVETLPSVPGSEQAWVGGRGEGGGAAGGGGAR